VHAWALPAEFSLRREARRQEAKATAGGFGLVRRRERELSTTADGNGITLKEPELRVGSATGLTGLAWELFIRAAERLEERRDRPAHAELRAA